MSTRKTHSTEPEQDFGFYANIPRIVRTGYKEIKPLHKWFYICLKDLCGDNGVCYRTIRTLSEETDLSLAFISEAIPLLHNAGLIHAEKKRRSSGGKVIWHITIVDIWQANAKKHPTNVRHANVNVRDTNNECSPRERECSPQRDRRNTSGSNTITEERTRKEEESTSPKDTVIVTENPPPPSILSSGVETHETQEKPEEKETITDDLLIEQMVAYSAEKNRETYTANEKRLLVSTATQILHDFPTLTLDQFKFSFDDWYKFVIGKRKTRLPMNYLLDTQQNNGIVRLQASLTLWEANQRRAQMHVVSSSTNAAEEIDGVASLLKSFPHLNLISASEPARRGSL